VRMSGALWVWRGGLSPRAARRARRSLSQLRARLSQTRGREVLAEHLGGLLAGEPLPVREAGVIELERVERRVAAGRARAARFVRRRRIARLVTRVERCLESLGGDAGVLVTAARGLVDRRRDAALNILAVAGVGDDEALHRARIAAKRWRYETEALGE